MKKYSPIFNYIIILIILLIVIYIISILYNMFSYKESMVSYGKENIEKLTDKWIHAVTVNNDPTEIYNMFCKDGSLVGTVSKELRSENDIKLYFNYFAKKPGIKVISRNYNVSKVTSNVYLNTAFITWSWDGLKEPIVARMTFIFRDNCIFQLHSSALPELNNYLLNISGKA